jgi:hypothetical protein
MTPKTQTRPSERRSRERRLAQLATGQQGVVARRQLLALGFGEEAIKIQLDAQRLHPLHREVYAVGHRRVSSHGRRWAAVLAYGDSAVLSHRSAATMWGLERRRRSVVDVTARVGRQGIHRRERIWV